MSTLKTYLMKTLRTLIVLVLIGLIKIGDFVLLTARLLLTPFQKLLHIRLPQLKKLQVERPRIINPSLPKTSFPKYSTRIQAPTLPSISFYKVNIRIPFPEVTLPHIRLPKISIPFSLFPKMPQVQRVPKPIIIHHTVYKPKKQIVFHIPLLSKFKYFIGGLLFSFLFIFLPILMGIFLQDLPSPKELTLRNIPQTTKIYDRNGILLYQIYASQNRTLVPLADIPIHLQNATIAVEDKDFYKHPGFDLTAIIRSVVSNASDKQRLQGGSTITQQLIKSALLSPERSVNRKVKEIILAFWAERLYSKNQILEMYFNQVAYGGTAWGVQAAAELYFGKNIKDLNLAESAFLAGLTQAPTTYSPFGVNPSLWKQRQSEVLQRMVNLGYLTKAQAEEAIKEELAFKTPQIPIHAPHFVFYVKDYLARQYGLPIVERGGLTVITSLDLKLHQQVQKIVTDQVNADAHLNLSNGAAVVTDPKSGDILAMAGSKDFSDATGGNVNLTTSLRQPGSSIKIVTYSAALANGFTAATVLDDSPITFPDSPPYRPVNYDGKFHGRVPLRLAFANSFNIPAVKLLNQIGVPTFVMYGKRLGIKSWGSANNYGLSITLGSAETTMLEMSTVYGVFANNGVRVDPNPILKVTDFKGNILEEKKTSDNNILAVNAASQDGLPIGERVLSEGVAFIISSILSDNSARSMAFGTNSILNIPGKTVSVKTGTSDNKRDNWTIGYTKDYVVASWVGNNDNTPMSQNLASGITGAAPIWNKIMTLLLSSKPDQRLVPPANVVQKPCYGRLEYFIKGTENSVNCAALPTPTPTPKP